MNTQIDNAMDRSGASLIELLIANSHQTTGHAPTLEYLTDEAFTFIDAGVDTSGRTMAAAVYYVLNNPDVERKLRAELDRCPVTDSTGKHVYVKPLSTLPYLVFHPISGWLTTIKAGN
jgi:cytochrome P450